MLFKSSEVSELDQLYDNIPVPPERVISILPKASPLQTEFSIEETRTNSAGSMILAVSNITQPF